MRKLLIAVLFTVSFAAACSGDDNNDNNVMSDGCDGVSCSGHGECVVKADGSAACLCEDDYEADDLECVAPDPCDGITCSDHGTCAVAAGEPLCACDTGYEADGLQCVTTDRCAGVDCSGHGDCVANLDELSCDCDDGYVADGLTCVDPCDGVDCSGLGSCSVEGAEAVCDCDDGYVVNGLACVDPCDGVDCSGHGTCEVDAGAAVCTCERGFAANETACEKAHDWVLVGSFAVTNPPQVTSGKFDALDGETIDFVLGIDVASIDKVDDFGTLTTTYSYDAAAFWIGGDNLSPVADAVLADVSADLDGQPDAVEVTVETATRVSFQNLTGVSSAEYFGLETGRFVFDALYDNEGFAELAPFENKTTTVILRRYTNVGGFTMTDFLMNDVALTLY